MTASSPFQPATAPRWRLSLKQKPELRVDLRGLLPATLANLSLGQVQALPVAHGRHMLELGELFTIHEDSSGDAGHLLLEGELARADHIGAGLTEGHITIHGDVGDYLGADLAGGSILVTGHARDLVACEMNGGRIQIDGNVGDFVASARPGSMDGMRGGTLVIGGAAGARLGDRMRRGTVAVSGPVGDFAASRLVAGTLAFGSTVGLHPAYAMRRGSLIFAGEAPRLSPTFVPSYAELDVGWGLLARSLARLGGPFSGLVEARPSRFLGDIAVDGQGELWIVT
ncbi:formylmethanofuran dehydrogenase subunit C [Xanthobacter sp. TB0139]|uniref:formylmethanofuran dehydrogenase subunit C n=1 Tax=Xanthobacter sp. TB0139 TaxID=3459178 RepID=UPI00403A7634